MKTYVVRLLMGSLSLLFLSSCATITRGTSEPYTIISKPPGASVKLSTGETCVTPCTVEKKRLSSFSVSIAKEGYEPIEVQVNNKSCKEGAAALAGSFIMVGGLIWAGIDSISGATKELTPNPCEVELVPTYKSDS